MPTAPNPLASLQSGALAGARRLQLRAGLTEFPAAIFDLADTLEELDLSGNALTALPADLHRLRRLKVLFASNNPFTELPPALGRCPQLELVGFKACRIDRVGPEALPEQLRWLILTDNRLADLPEALGQRPRLQKLMLAGNRLSRLPLGLRSAAQLELVRIAANAFERFPALLAELPRLAWLAVAGNPFSDALEAQGVARHPGACIDWSALTLHERLGEGASGLIHAATWRRVPPADVAVKLFKGAVTSDGLPRSEMTASIAAGTHPHLIGIEGRIVGHPQGVDGLVMARVGREFQTLAAPPSLSSCTRDVYAADLRLAPTVALRVGQGLAAAVAHLHERGILHGDLYGHNTVVNDDGDARLGDFGAASFLPVGDATLSGALRRMEMRALAVLLGELIEHLADGNDPTPQRARADLQALHESALTWNP
jgi:Protein tyrosine and serine/threonine kinase